MKHTWGSQFLWGGWGVLEIAQKGTLPQIKKKKGRQETVDFFFVFFFWTTMAYLVRKVIKTCKAAFDAINIERDNFQILNNLHEKEKRKEFSAWNKSLIRESELWLLFGEIFIISLKSRRHFIVLNKTNWGWRSGNYIATMQYVQKETLLKSIFDCNIDY